MQGSAYTPGCGLLTGSSWLQATCPAWGFRDEPPVRDSLLPQSFVVLWTEQSLVVEIHHRGGISAICFLSNLAVPPWFCPPKHSITMYRAAENRAQRNPSA